LLFAACLATLQSLAVAAGWDLEALMKELAVSRSGTASFVETKFLAVLDAPIKQSGTLAYSPDHLEKVTLLPRRERVLIKGNALTIESGSGKKIRHVRLSRYPVLWGFVEGMRATLTGDLNTLKRFYDIELHGWTNDWELLLSPRQQKMHAVVSLIRIRGGAGLINVIELVESNGDRSVMHVTEDTS
jgi:hypothetical protein